MNDNLTAKCAGCGKWKWLGDMFWRGDKRYCGKCAADFEYQGGV